MIGRELGRSSGTFCDEIRRHGAATGYLPATAEADAAVSRHRSGRQPRLALDGPLFHEIAPLLRLGWSPEQISGRRKRVENGMGTLPACGSRTRRSTPRSMPCLAANYGASCCPVCARPSPCGAASRRVPNGGKLCCMTNIRDRPEEIEGRLVPGHWEGNLILGAGGASAVGTLVERTARLVVLVHMATRRADVAASAFAAAPNAIPAPFARR